MYAWKWLLEENSIIRTGVGVDGVVIAARGDIDNVCMGTTAVSINNSLSFFSVRLGFARFNPLPTAHKSKSYERQLSPFIVLNLDLCMYVCS